MRKLKICVIDDDHPEGSIDALLKIFDDLFGRDNVDVDTPGLKFSGYGPVPREAWQFAQERLPGDFDLVLFDVNLGSGHERGGVQLFREHKDVLATAGTAALVYSAKPEAAELCRDFWGSEGFFFVPRDPGLASDGRSEWRPMIIRALRGRVMRILSRASLAERSMGAGAGSREVTIGGVRLSVDSLLAPFLVGLPGETTPVPEAVRARLFGLHPLSLYSHLFKANAFLWPSDAPFGLRYRQGSDKGCLDEVTHLMAAQGFTQRVAFARAQVDEIRSFVDPTSRAQIEKWLSRCEREAPDEVAAEQFKSAFRFEWRQIGEALSGDVCVDYGPEIPEGVVTCPDYCGTTTSHEAVLTLAAQNLRTSLAERSTAVKVSFLAPEPEDGTRDRGDVGLWMVVRSNPSVHFGHLSALKAAMSLSGHSLSEANRLLLGYCDWYFLESSGTAGHPALHAAVTPRGVEALSDEHGSSLLSRIGGWQESSSMHVLQFRIPRPKLQKL